MQKKTKKKTQNNTFSERVKEVVRKIPAGETKSYQEVADLAGNKKASRAVANQMAKNYDLEIPCHRVIRKDGSMGGYNRGGVKVKAELLRKERLASKSKNKKELRN